MESPTVATYPSAGGRHEAHGCVFHGRKTRGVATNIYLRKTLEKPKVGLWTLGMKGSRVVFTHREGIRVDDIEVRRDTILWNMNRFNTYGRISSVCVAELLTWSSSVWVIRKTYDSYERTSSLNTYERTSSIWVYERTSFVWTFEFFLII